MNIEKVKELIKVFEASELKKITVKEGDFEVVLEKEDMKGEFIPVQQSHISIPHPHSIPHPSHKVETKTQPAEVEGVFVKSPMVGTFYTRAAPDQPQFVKVGDFVKEDTVICIIEAMKVMNEVKAGISGRIAEIIFEDAHPVEFGTKMFRIIK